MCPLHPNHRRSPPLLDPSPIRPDNMVSVLLIIYDFQGLHLFPYIYLALKSLHPSRSLPFHCLLFPATLLISCWSACGGGSQNESPDVSVLHSFKSSHLHLNHMRTSLAVTFFFFPPPSFFYFLLFFFLHQCTNVPCRSHYNGASHPSHRRSAGIIIRGNKSTVQHND